MYTPCSEEERLSREILQKGLLTADTTDRSETLTGKAWKNQCLMGVGGLRSVSKIK